MNLTETPEIVQWPPTHYVFVEKTGPFMDAAPEAWGLAHSLAPLLLENNQIAGYMSLYKMSPKIYRACFALSAAPVKLPQGLQYEIFEGGKYSRFVLTGPYTHLPAASGRVFELASKNDWMLRAGWCIENYANDPRITPEDKLITEILLPIDWTK